MSLDFPLGMKLIFEVTLFSCSIFFNQKSNNVLEANHVTVTRIFLRRNESEVNEIISSCRSNLENLMKIMFTD